MNLRRVFILFIVLFGFYQAGRGQNLQLHYDLGKYKDDNGAEHKREYFTTTFEMFKLDKLGNTFMFIDINYNTQSKGASLAYFELSRNFNIPKVKNLQLHLEYNDGVAPYISQVWLAGLAYPIKIGNAVFPSSISYRAEQGSKSANLQFTTTWNFNFWKNRISLTGFLDVWTKDAFNSEGKVDGKTFVLLTEPQLWLNLNDTFSLGGEVEISENFLTTDNRIKVLPTVAFKWNL